jgi:hypothetical protein
VLGVDQDQAATGETIGETTGWTAA